jgi:hypothetical protein
MVQVVKMSEFMMKHVLDEVLGKKQQIPIQVDVALLRTATPQAHLVFHIRPLETQSPVIS